MHRHPVIDLGAEFGRKDACRIVRGNQQILQIALWKSHLTGEMEPDRGIPLSDTQCLIRNHECGLTDIEESTDPTPH